MRRSRVLEDRLEEWGREYGGSRYELHDIGSNIASLVKWGGRAPQGMRAVVLNTPADEVQAAFEAMQRDGYRVPAMVLALEYQKPGQPLESKLYQLRRMGENLGRTRYYAHLRTARERVARAIGVALELELLGAAILEVALTRTTKRAVAVAAVDDGLSADHEVGHAR